DIVFLRKRAVREPAKHVDPEWLRVSPLAIEGVENAINRYFLNHPEMVLGDWSRKDRLYGGQEGYSLIGNGPLGRHPAGAIGHLPPLPTAQAAASPVPVPIKPLVKPALNHITEGSFFVGDNRVIYQCLCGQNEPVTYGGTLLKSNGTKT